MIKYRKFLVLLCYVFSIYAFSQSPFVVNYNFDSDLSGTLTQGVGVAMHSAVSGGHKLFGATVTTDASENVWRANVVDNNATNYNNTFIRFDIYPPAGQGIIVSNILVNQRYNIVNGGTLFRIGCTLNGVRPVNSNVEQSTGNIQFTDAYSVNSFSPGSSVNYAIGSDYISVFVCARGTNVGTYEWSINDIEIQGSVVDAATPSVSIDNTKQQLIEVMGGDMARSSDFIHKANNTNEILDWFIKDIDYNFFRVRYDKKQELTEGAKDWNFYANQVLTMRRIREINPSIKFLATMRTDYQGFGDGNHNNLPVFIYNYECLSEDANGQCNSSAGDLSFNIDKYGIFLADYIEFMYNEGVPIDYLATSKEWQVVTVQRSHDVYIKMSSELTNRGVPIPKVIGPATWGINVGINYVNTVVANNYEDEYFAFSSHDLGNTPTLWESFVNASSQGNKMAFDDESGYYAGGRTNGVEPTTMDGLLAKYSGKHYMYDAGVSGEIFFEVWSRGINSETRSVYIRNGEDGYRMRSYYVMKEFVNSAINKNYCKSNLIFAPNVTALVFRDDNVASVWLINEGAEVYNDLSLEITGETIYGNIQQRYWNDPTKTEAFEDILTNSVGGTSSINVNLSPKSINHFRLAINPSAVLSTAKKKLTKLSLFPNPVKNYLSLTGIEQKDNSLYEIYNLSGVKIKKGDLINSQQINVTNLSSGIYFLHFENQTFKFIKE